MNKFRFNVGDVVLLREYGNDKFLVCRGWYLYEGSRRNGLYFKLIPEGTIVPDFKVNVPEDIIVVDSVDDTCNRPRPPKPSTSGYFVTVDTIEDRNKLVFPQLQDGKIVRVNDVQGQVKYYIWNAEYYKWEDYEFPASVDVTERIASLDQRLIPVESSYNWVYMNDLVNSLEAVS